jgi:hypothetical protein
VEAPDTFLDVLELFHQCREWPVLSYCFGKVSACLLLDEDGALDCLQVEWFAAGIG